MQLNVYSKPSKWCSMDILCTQKGPDPRKVEAISDMPIQSNKTELQSYIGMCNFLSS